MARANRHYIPGYIWHTPVEFVERTKKRLGIRAKGREVSEMEGQFKLREPGASYKGRFGPEKGDIVAENTYAWNDYLARMFHE
jgi:hypothetical protein